ncbi:MAG: glutamate-5-semialdehyde dehydrogenase [Candidatus Bruticola sp.]
MADMETVRDLAVRAKKASFALANLKTGEKNIALAEIAKQLRLDQELILEANRRDLGKAKADGASPAFLDRLSLSAERIAALADSVLKVAQLADPVGREEGWRRPNGLSIRKVQVPLGVIAMIYEARPNVTVDSAVLCLKSGNACLLRGSSHAAESNKVLAASMRQALQNIGQDPDFIIPVEQEGRAVVDELAQLNGLIDCIIPRGGHSLISRVKAISSVPVIETGVGNCHLYVHAKADLDMALRILINGKTQRPGVCNALETLLIDNSVAADFLQKVAQSREMAQVILHGSPEVCTLSKDAVAATEEDWDKEYLSLDIAVKIVDNLNEAIEHINKHSSGHSEAIITQDWQAAKEFQQRISSCAVYVNASTRFTDGGEFGFGAEIGISTQKLHARGPLGLEALTTNKYLIEGEGQIR